MTKEFIPYEQALELKELGFDEECLKWYYNGGEPTGDHIFLIYKKDSCFALAPLWQQAFRWFREKHDYEYRIRKLIEEDGYMASIGWAGVEDICEQAEGKTYEEAELACLNKLIEMVKNQKP